jgi:hypothetical protein
VLLTWDDKGVKVLIEPRSRSTFGVNVTGWSKGLEVTGGGQGIVSHAGLVLLRALADRTGLTAGLSKALASRRLLIHDRGRELADLACAIADGAEVISDFRVIADQQELFGLVASVPTCWRVLSEIGGGIRPLARITAAVNAARHRAWAQIVARHGGLPAVAVADKVLEGVTCIRLDATVTPAHSDKELAEPNYKGFGHHPLLAYCDNTSEPLAGMITAARCASAVPMTPAPMPAAPTARAGWKKPTWPSSPPCCAAAGPGTSSPAGHPRCASSPAASGPTPAPS